jgi:hypothetical protein
MAIPSGSGTEVLKYSSRVGTAASTNNFILINGVANHIYTILSIIITEIDGATDAVFQLTLNSAGSGNTTADTYLYKDLAVGAKGVFVWNDKFVFSGDLELCIRETGGSSGNFDVHCSYIDQDWS